MSLLKMMFGFCGAGPPHGPPHPVGPTLTYRPVGVVGPDPGGPSFHSIGVVGPDPGLSHHSIGTVRTDPGQTYHHRTGTVGIFRGTVSFDPWPIKGIQNLPFSEPWTVIGIQQ